MTSKTFKSTMTDSRELEVDVIFSNPRLLIKESGNGRSGFVFAPSDAPALALAILEAAGVVPVQRDYESYDDGTPAHLQAVAYFLKQHNEAQERATAEAEAQAELEAEALELFNTFWRSDGEGPSSIENWRVPNEEREDWLAVARRAREMRAEK